MTLVLKASSRIQSRINNESNVDSDSDTDRLTNSSELNVKTTEQNAAKDELLLDNKYLANKVRQLRAQFNAKLQNYFYDHILSSDKECNHYTGIPSIYYIHKYNSGHIHIF